MALFQTSPNGLGLFLPSAALSVAYVEWLHSASSALLKIKIATSSGEDKTPTDPG
jgi:hypothetical protein